MLIHFLNYLKHETAKVSGSRTSKIISRLVSEDCTTVTIMNVGKTLGVLRHMLMIL